MSRRILFTSPIQPIGGCSPNVYSWDKKPAAVRIAMSFLDHPGLSFLEANLPVEILPYPDESTFAAALREPPDILGISFYINETEVALEMARRARAAGVQEVWAGNFGAYSPQVESTFDRVWTGWSEEAVAHALEVPLPGEHGVRHPEIYGAIGTNLFPKMVLSGILFTSRGCPFTCNFCQTPGFYGKAKPIPLEEVDRVLKRYHRQGVRGINILDENFGTFPGHAREVVELLHRYDMRWIALTRVDTLLRNFDHWHEHGLFGAHLGIESLNSDSLEGASKRIADRDSVKLLARMQREHLFVQAFYILGFEEDTVESIRSDIRTLERLAVDVVQVQVLTPYPKTGQRDAIEAQFGIHDANLSHYNSRNLVWNHPSISPAQMRELQRWANRRLTSSQRALRTLAKFAVFNGRRRPTLEGIRGVLAPFFGTAARLHRQLEPKLSAARRWSREGWRAYEEVPTNDAVSAVAAHRQVPAPGS